MLALSVAKVAKCKLRINNTFTLVIELSVAEAAEVAGFSGVRGVGYNNVVLALWVAKVAECMFRKNNKFTLEFDFSVAEIAEVARFSRVRGVGYNNVCACIVGSKSRIMQVT